MTGYWGFASVILHMLADERSFAAGDFYFSDDTLRFRACQVDGQKPIFQVGSKDLDPLGQDKGPLELTGGNAAMQILPGPG